MPESVKKSRYAKPGADGGKADLRPLEAVDAGTDEASDDGDNDKAPAVAPAAATARDDGEPAQSEGDAPDDEQAQKRRAAFRVIDGGS